MSPRRMVWLVLGLAALSGAAHADEPARSLRLIADAPSATDPAPQHFVIDALVKSEGGEAQSTVEGWMAAVEAPAASGELSGSCVERHCVLTVDVNGDKLSIVGDFGAPTGPVKARFTLKDDEGKVLQQGAVTLTPLDGAVPGLGALAPPTALTANQLDDLLMWIGETVAAGTRNPEDPPDSFGRDTLATWQEGKGHLATGLIFAADLAELRAEAQAARKAAGWTALGDAAKGWTAGYPATLLPKASRAGAEQSFASADRKARLLLVIDPPMSGEAFDTFVHTTTADREGRTNTDYTRVNDDLEMRYEEDGKVTVAAYHNREGGMARMIFTYPADASDTYKPFEAILQRGLKVEDSLKR